jgi:hypothetical protein
MRQEVRTGGGVNGSGSENVPPVPGFLGDMYESSLVITLVVPGKPIEAWSGRKYSEHLNQDKCSGCCDQYHKNRQPAMNT